MDVINSNDIDEAATLFEQKFNSALDKHAPIRTFQQHKHYLPFLSDNTKSLMKRRDELKKSATTNNYLMNIYIKE